MSNTVFQLFVLTLKWGLNCNVYLLLIHRIYMHYLFTIRTRELLRARLSRLRPLAARRCREQNTRAQNGSPPHVIRWRAQRAGKEMPNSVIPGRSIEDD